MARKMDTADIFQTVGSSPVDFGGTLQFAAPFPAALDIPPIKPQPKRWREERIRLNPPAQKPPGRKRIGPAKADTTDANKEDLNHDDFQNKKH